MDLALGDGADLEAYLIRGPDRARLGIGARSFDVEFQPAGQAHDLKVDGRAEKVWWAAKGDQVFVHAYGRSWTVTVSDPREASLRGADADDAVAAPMPGTVTDVLVSIGDGIQAGQALMVIESMKMRSEITASRDGIVEKTHLSPGDTFDRGAILVSLEPTEAAE